MAHKDIFCTEGVRTSCGSKMLDSFIAPYTATVVEKMAAEGAVMLGKTNMDEYAMGSSNMTSHYGPVINPWKATGGNNQKKDLVPGGSSGGSAAAVADQMTPLAIGTQTGGSMIRPASFCGVFGYKPTFGSISRRGVSMLARRLDTIGVYGRTADDLALIGDALMVHDPEDWDMLANPGRDLTGAMAEGLPDSFKFAFVRTPAWDQGEPDMTSALEAFVKGLGDVVQDVTLEGVFDDIVNTHKTVIHANVATFLGEAAEKAPEKMRLFSTGVPF